jgi:hypothetical protein
MPHPRGIPLLATVLATVALAMVGFAARAQSQMRERPAADEYTAAPSASEATGSERSVQKPKGPPIRELTELLGLDQTQASALDAALRERHQQREAMRQRTDEQRKASMDASDEKLRKLLTPAQYGTFRQWEAQHRPPHDGPGEADRRPPPPSGGRRPKAQEG